MPDPDEAVIEAKVTRYSIARLRLAQLLVPLAIVANVLARRAPSVAVVVSSLALLALGFVAFLSAAKRFGWTPLQFEGGAISLGQTGVRVERKRIRSWTLIGTVARLYLSDTSFRLQARRGTEQVLGALLRSQLGSPVSMNRRGSKLARLLALCAALLGLAISALAVAKDNSGLAVVGAPTLILGIAFFGALSQRVAQP